MAHTRHAQAAVAAGLRHRIKTLIGISTAVNVGLPETLERTLVGKARRVIDKRHK